jgi:hypothetical protein
MDVPESEWQGARTYLEDANVAVGLLNDDEYLYVSLVTSDRMKLGQLLRSGLTLWFDPSGRDEKSLGIRFPLERERAGPPMTSRGERQDPDEMLGIMEELIESMKVLEILGPGEDEERRLAIADAQGIDVQVGFTSGALIYELRVPLEQSTDHPYAIGAEKGGLVSIGFETPEINVEEMRESTGGGGGMGGRGGGKGGGRGGGGRGGMGGRGGGMNSGGRGGSSRPPMPEPLDVWIVAQLASGGESASESND